MKHRKKQIQLSGRFRKEKKRKSQHCLWSGVLLRLWSDACVFSGFQELVKTRRSPQVSSISHLCPGARGLRESVVWKIFMRPHPVTP